MKTILAFIRIVLLAIISLLTIVLGQLLLLLSGNSYKVKLFVVKAWAKSSLFILNVKLTAKGTFPLEAGIVMPNHRSYIDIFVLLANRPAAIVAKAEIGSWPGLSLAVNLGNMILVDRKDPRSSIHTMVQIKDRLVNNQSVILFPEGGIFGDQYTSPFKRGSFLLASKLEASITPVALYYPHRGDAWIGSISFFSHFMRQMGKWRTKVYMQVLPTINPIEPKELMEKVRSQIDEAIRSLEAR